MPAVRPLPVSRPAPRLRGWRSLLSGGVLAAALAAPAAVPAPAARAAPAAAVAPAALPGGCSYHQISGGFQWICASTASSGGSRGSGGSSAPPARPACTIDPVTQAQGGLLALPAPPAGQQWAIVSCGRPPQFTGTILVSAAGPGHMPAATPQQLAQIAVGDLILPAPQPGLAPPAGKDGLVGLPQWFWVPAAAWHRVQTARVQAGPVWAIATATPETLVFTPGDGHQPVRCPGPGTAYSPQLSAAAQHTACSYTYQQPSAGQPGSAYPASVTVLWNVSWTGSGGTGGTVADGKPVSAPLALPVASGQALVTGP